MNDYRNSLLSLAGAVGEGMDPNQAYSIYQNLLGQHSSQMAARQQRVGSLVDLLVNQASSGLPADQMQMVLSAATGGNVPPKVESAMQTIYPNEGATWVNGQAANYSPLYQGPSPEEQMANMQLEQAQGQMQAQTSMAPGLATAFTSAAMRLTEPQPVVDANGQPVIGPDGQPQMQPGITGQQALTQMTLSPEFNALPAQTQALIMQSIQAAIAKKNEDRAKAEQVAATQATQQESAVRGIQPQGPTNQGLMAGPQSYAGYDPYAYLR